MMQATITPVQEIERKFLLPSAPSKKPALVSEIEQYYLPNEFLEIRFRRTEEGSGHPYCTITLKVGTGLSRHEHTHRTSEETFSSIASIHSLPLLKKTRMILPESGSDEFREACIDIYHEPYKNLIIAEFEFYSKEDAMCWEPYPWLGEEITGNNDYYNLALWRGLAQS